jgi:hypothetical protein
MEYSQSLLLREQLPQTGRSPSHYVRQQKLSALKVLALYFDFAFATVLTCGSNMLALHYLRFR